MATTTTTSLSGGCRGDDRMATAQQIVKSLNMPANVREGMLLIFSSFDNRLSNITDLVNDDDRKARSKLDAAEQVIMRWDSSQIALPSWCDGPEDVVDYLTAVDEVLDDLSFKDANIEAVDRAETAVQAAMTRLEVEFRHILTRNTVPLDVERLYGSIRRVSISFVGNEGEIIDDEFESFGEVDSARGSGY